MLTFRFRTAGDIVVLGSGTVLPLWENPYTRESSFHGSCAGFASVGTGFQETGRAWRANIRDNWGSHDSRFAIIMG